MASNNSHNDVLHLIDMLYETVDEAKENYRQALNLEDVEAAPETQAEPVTGIISAVESAVVSGNTCYYFTLEGSEDIYSAPITLSPELPFLQPGDSVTFVPAEGSPIPVVEWR